MKEDYDRLVKEGKKPVPVLDKTGKIIKYEAQSVVPATGHNEGTVGSKAAAKTTVKPTDRKLPETGTEKTALTALGLAMLSIAALFGLKRKEEN